MRFRFHAVLLGIPLGLWIMWFGINAVGRARVAANFKDVNGLIWHFDTSQLMAKSDYSKNGEIERFEIKIINNENKVLYDNAIEIDWDMGGGGFLKAVQADNDSDLEIVCVKKGGQSNFYLDVSADNVVKKSLKFASPSAQLLVKNGLKYYAPNPFTIGFCFMITLVYYFSYFPVSWIYRKIFHTSNRY